MYYQASSSHIFLCRLNVRSRALTHWCLYTKIALRMLVFFYLSLSLLLSVQFSAKWGYSEWNSTVFFGVKSTEWVGGKKRACFLANILAVKRCNQILCSMCGSNIIGKPDHSEVLSAVPVSGRNCNQFSINICYSCAATNFSWFFDQKALGLYFVAIENNRNT